jgi:hypothetical protein
LGLRAEAAVTGLVHVEGALPVGGDYDEPTRKICDAQLRFLLNMNARIRRAG